MTEEKIEKGAQVETGKLSKTAKRRLKKEQEEKERQSRIKAAIDEERLTNCVYKCANLLFT